MREKLSLLEKIAGWIALNLLSESLTLFSNRLGKWYDKNGFYKFHIGNKIRLKDLRISGYDPSEVLEVKGYTEEGGYRTVNSEEQTHSKWNIEHCFCLIR